MYQIVIFWCYFT